MNIQTRLKKLEDQVQPEPPPSKNTGIVVVNPGESLSSAIARLKQNRPELSETPDKYFTTVIRLVAPEEDQHDK